MEARLDLKRTDFLAYFPEPRQRGKAIYPLQEILLCPRQCSLDRRPSLISRSSVRRASNVLRRFLPFRNGTLSRDYLCNIFATLDATELQRGFVRWAAKLIGYRLSTARPRATPPMSEVER
jgi:hypothetical protein